MGKQPAIGDATAAQHDLTLRLCSHYRLDCGLAWHGRNPRVRPQLFSSARPAALDQCSVQSASAPLANLEERNIRVIEIDRELGIE
jgi:hypothetical protein